MSGKKLFWPIFLFVRLVLPGCGEESSNEAPAAFRVVEAVSADASCDAEEMLLSAYCFSDQGRSISASGPALQPNAAGTIVATCLTGGRHLRLFFVRQP